MIIPCFRCDKEIDTPNSSNADYVIADDMIARERRDKYVEVPKSQAELDAEEAGLRSELQANEEIIRTYKLTNINPQEIPIEDIYGEIDAIEETLQIGLEKTKRVLLRGKRLEDVQKTGIICPDCYEETDFVIWGVHKTVLI